MARSYLTTATVGEVCRVSAYYEFTLRHLVSYDDGDEEVFHLWGPTQMIKLLNRKQDFAMELERLETRLQASAQAAANHKEALLNVRSLLIPAVLALASIQYLADRGFLGVLCCFSEY